MLYEYPAIFFCEKEGGWSVVFPDLNHLATCGDDLNEAQQMAIDCLAGYIWSEKVDGHDIPAPSVKEDVDFHCEDDGDDSYIESESFVQYVSVDPDEYIKSL